MDFSATNWLMGLVAALGGGGALAAWKSLSNRMDELEARELSRASSDGALAERVKSLDDRMLRIETKLDQLLTRLQGG